MNKTQILTKLIKLNDERLVLSNTIAEIDNLLKLKKKRSWNPLLN